MIAVLLPKQIAGLTAVAVIVGIGLTVIVTVPVFTQPAALVPVIVYIVVLVALHVTVVPVVALSPAEGDQVYVAAPEAVIAVELPRQMDGLTAVPVTTGKGLTVIVTMTVFEQPAADVPVTV